MHSISILSELVEQELKQVELPNQPQNLYQPIDYTLEHGGKRLRPVMCLMAAELFGQDVSKALPTAIACEVFHNFTLVHDDLMDAAPIRRGKPTVYKKWDNNVAVLSGDAMLIKSYELLNKFQCENLHQIFSVFSKFALEVCEGQQYDMDFEQRTDVSLEEYIEMIRLKTSVLFGGVMQLGAIIANASKENQELAYQFGVNFGLAFQLQDDYLDSFGDQATFGKSIGGDILSNKKTALLIKASELADFEQKIELEQLLSAKEIAPEEKIAKVKSIYVQTGTSQYTLNLVEEYFSKAHYFLDKIQVSEERKLMLKNLLNKLSSRNK